MDEERTREYRTVIAEPYVIFYRLDETTLTVYRILHRRQDIGTHIIIDFP